MRRRLALLGLLCLSLLSVPALAATAQEHGPHRLPAQAADRATEALEEVQAILAGRGGEDRELTLKLTQLALLRDKLPAAERRQADAILARPTQGASDPQGDGYTVAETTPICKTNVCVHYVRTTADAPSLYDGSDTDTLPDWVQRTANHMQAVWNMEVGTLGYVRPASDGTRGGDSRLDVYLADIGDQDLYGYCATEGWVVATQSPRTDFRRFGYCVLDDDYASAQFGTRNTPINNLRVTAAHEFFHAIQFNYDAAEDPWIMEATATWMEERYADDVNDNRQYLPGGQVVRNSVPLDLFGSDGNSYGNWAFFELLSRTYGVGAVRDVWNRLSSAPGARDNYSTQGVDGYLYSKGTRFWNFYARFALANTMPARFYEFDEGRYWPSAPIPSVYRLSNGTRSTGNRSLTLNHQTNRNYRFLPTSTLTGVWRLRLYVNGPSQGMGAAAHVVVQYKDNRVQERAVTLNSNGDAIAFLPFSPSTVSAVTMSIANGSTRFTNCWAGTAYSCSGQSLDNNRQYAFSATAVR